jgi:hypothetical protein
MVIMLHHWGDEDSTPCARRRGLDREGRRMHRGVLATIVVIPVVDCMQMIPIVRSIAVEVPPLSGRRALAYSRLESALPQLCRL